MSDAAPVVCALDFSAGSEAALVRAADLAERFQAPLHLLCVDSQPVPTDGAVARGDGDALSRLQAFAEKTLGRHGQVQSVRPQAIVTRAESAADAIVGYAREVDALLVVTGTHGRRGVRRMVLGSVAEAVVQRAPCRVLVVPDAAAQTRPGPEAPVLVAVDFSGASLRAVDVARGYAFRYHAPVEALHVVEGTAAVPDFYATPYALDRAAHHDLPTVEEAARGQLQDVADRGGVGAHVATGVPHRVITARATEIGAGLVVLATHGLTGVAHAVMGSVAERTLRRAPCPVLVTRVDP